MPRITAEQVVNAYQYLTSKGVNVRVESGAYAGVKGGSCYVCALGLVYERHRVERGKEVAEAGIEDIEHTLKLSPSYRKGFDDGFANQHLSSMYSTHPSAIAAYERGEADGANARDALESELGEPVPWAAPDGEDDYYGDEESW